MKSFSKTCTRKSNVSFNCRSSCHWTLCHCSSEERKKKVLIRNACFAIVISSSLVGMLPLLFEAHVKCTCGCVGLCESDCDQVHFTFNKWKRKKKEQSLARFCCRFVNAHCSCFLLILTSDTIVSFSFIWFIVVEFVCCDNWMVHTKNEIENTRRQMCRRHSNDLILFNWISFLFSSLLLIL